MAHPMHLALKQNVLPRVVLHRTHQSTAHFLSHGRVDEWQWIALGSSPDTKHGVCVYSSCSAGASCYRVARYWTLLHAHIDRLMRSQYLH